MAGYGTKSKDTDTGTAPGPRYTGHGLLKSDSPTCPVRKRAYAASNDGLAECYRAGGRWDKQECLSLVARISNLIQTSRPSGGLERLYS